MKRSPGERGLSQLLCLLPFAGVVCLASQITQSEAVKTYLLPTSTAVAIFAAFGIVLRWRASGYLFGEIGFVYMGLALAYTIIPGIKLMSGGPEPSDPLFWLSPSQSELSIHLWRHVLFMACIGTGYLAVRGRQKVSSFSMKAPAGEDRLIIVFLLTIAAACIFLLIYMSAPVDNYWDNYTRYDHLSWSARKLVSVCLRLKFGIYSVLLTFLFINYKKYRPVIPVVVVALCLHDLLYSRGSRIETFVIILQVMFLYHSSVRQITLRQIATVGVPAAMLFSLIEVLRVGPLDAGLDFSAFRFPVEFDSVYLTGFHLYAERAQAMLPPTEWPMFFNEFISVLPFGDFDRWNPIVWYMNNYFPNSAVPPFTLGPIADSAIWGGEVDLAIRGLISGAFFACMARWFLVHKEKWWGLCLYSYCIATSILTLKYSVFYHLSPLAKTLLPVMLLVALVKLWIASQKKVLKRGRNLLRLGAPGGAVQSETIP